MSEHFAIIGNGAAGFRAAKAIRRADSAAQISIFTREAYPFYLRRQLGDLLSGALDLAELVFQGRNAYRRERLDLFLMTEVAAVRPAEHEIHFASGDHVQYDRLLVATGTEAARLDLPGAGLAGVVCFDELDRAVEMRRLLESARSAVVLDEGMIGLALAENLAAKGLRVTQLVRGDRYWPEMFDETTGSLVEVLLAERGVTLRKGVRPRSIVGCGNRAIGVETADGELIAAELVAYGGARRPAVRLLEDSGIAIGHGIRVDRHFRTSQSGVWAAGDAVEPVDPEAAGQCCFCWQRAWTQGGQAAASMLDRPGETAPDALRLRGSVFGRELAVIGRGHLAARPDAGIIVRETRDARDVYRRLVFDGGHLVGAVVFGTGETVYELNQMVADRLHRDMAEPALEAAVTGEMTETVLPQTFARHCPICAAELVVYRGHRIGGTVCCQVCNTELVVCWNGQRGWLDIPHR